MSARIPSSAAVASIRTVADRLIELAENAPDSCMPVAATHGWTLTHVIAHLVAVVTRYSPDAGPVDAWTTDVQVSHRTEIERLPAYDLPGATAALRTAVARLPSGPALDAAGPVPYTGGVEVVPADLYGLILGEFVVHGHDVATSLHRHWRIDPDDAALVIRAVSSVLPAWVDRDRAGHACCVIEVRVRGDRRYRWWFTDGTLTVDPPSLPHRPDVTISARPGAMVLLFYGRLPMWRGVATGRMLAWGRRPGLAFAAAGYFRSP